MIKGPHKWSQTLTHWYPKDAKRKRGRQIRRWEEDMYKAAGPLWSRNAQNRDKGNDLEEAYVSGQAGDNNLKR